jgi:mRNA interferase RelE/StbE
MSYKLFFIRQSKKEWDKLPEPIKGLFKKKLVQRLENPHVPKDRLHGLQNCYKIKLRDLGYRLVYRVEDKEVVVTVVAVGKRDKMEVYLKAKERLH